MSQNHQHSSPSMSGDALLSYTPFANVRPNESNSESPFSPAGEVQQARFQQTVNTVVDDGGLPEVVVPGYPKNAYDSESDGLIPVTSSPTIKTPAEVLTTSLNLLGDQPEVVECPFCRRRAETRVQKEPSYVTHLTATTLFFTTFAGAVAPYACHWNSNVSHYCSNCDRKVAFRRYRAKQTKALGTPDHLRVASRFPAAGPSTDEK